MYIYVYICICIYIRVSTQEDEEITLLSNIQVLGNAMHYISRSFISIVMP